MTLEELLAKTNEKQAELWPTGQVRAITDRTLRYWINEGLLPKRATRGPQTTYPEAFIDRLLFIRHMQQHTSLSLRQIKTQLESRSDEQITLQIQDAVKADLTKDPDPHANLHEDVDPSFIMTSLSELKLVTHKILGHRLQENADLINSINTQRETAQDNLAAALSSKLDYFMKNLAGENSNAVSARSDQMHYIKEELLLSQERLHQVVSEFHHELVEQRRFNEAIQLKLDSLTLAVADMTRGLEGKSR